MVSGLKQEDEVADFGRFDDEECAICLASPQRNKSSTSCGHVFCHKCLNQCCWAKLECPTCREPIREFLCGPNWKEGVFVDSETVRRERIKDMRNILLGRLMRDSNALNIYNSQLERDRSGEAICNDPNQFVDDVLWKIDGKQWMNDYEDEDLLKQVIIAAIVSR